MGIKNEEPEDKVIFDSIDNRMKYSKGVKVEQTDPCDCVYKENPGLKVEGIKNDIVKTESELDIKLNKIEDLLKDISYDLELLGDEIDKIEERLGI